MGEDLRGNDSSPVRSEGPPRERIERSGRVKGKVGRGLWEKKGRRKAKLDICSRRPVQPVSAMRGGLVTELRALKGRPEEVRNWGKGG
jgi:hypothetical protein